MRNTLWGSLIGNMAVQMEANWEKTFLLCVYINKNHFKSESQIPFTGLWVHTLIYGLYIKLNQFKD